MADQRHIMIANLPRAASLWLADTIKINSAEPHLDVSHDGWMGSVVTRKLRGWQTNPGTHINVSRDNYSMAPILCRLFPAARWCCLWREPRADFLSIVGLRNIQLQDTGQMLFQVGNVYQSIEASLRFLEERGIQLTHWHMDFYTQPHGVRALAAELDIALTSEFKPSTKYNQRSYKVYESDLPAAVMDYAEELFFSNPRIKAAYESARRE